MRSTELLIGAGVTAGVLAAIYYATRPVILTSGTTQGVGRPRPVNTGGGGRPSGGLATYLSGILTANASLPANTTLYSADGNYCVTMQGDGNLVVTTKAGAVVWAANTSGSGAVVARVQTDGNVVLYNARNVAVWSTGSVPSVYGLTEAPSMVQLVMQNDGNLVVYWQYLPHAGARTVLTGSIAVWSSRGGLYQGSLYGTSGGVY